MPLVSITTPAKCRTRAGIAKMFVTECANVTDITFDADHQITAIVMDGVSVFHPIQFAKNTANFEQVKTVTENSSINVAQTINFTFRRLDNAVRKGLYELNQSCCIHAIVQDNEGEWWYFGISYFPETDSWISEDMSTSEGSANSGEDPSGDQVQMIESLAANSNFFAVKWTLGEAGIPVAT